MLEKGWKIQLAILDPRSTPQGLFDQCRKAPDNTRTIFTHCSATIILSLGGLDLMMGLIWLWAEIS